MLTSKNTPEQGSPASPEDREMSSVFYFVHEPRYSGPAKRILSSSDALKKAGFNTVIVIRDAHETIEAHCDERDVKCIKVKIAKIPRPSLIREVLSWIFRVPIDSLRLWRLLGQFQPDIVVVNGAFFIIPALVCRLRRRPLVWYVNDTILPSALARLAGKIVKSLADVVVTQGDGVARFHGLRPSEYVNIYSGVDLGKFTFVPRSPDFYRGRLKVGLVAQWAPNKGHHHFLAAARRVRDVFGERVSFVLAGSRLVNQQEYQALIDRLIADLSLRDCVEERGFVDDVPTLMQELHLLVMASTKGDACSNAVLEAMASGVPVVTTTVGSSTELVEGKGLDRAGYAVPPGDEQAMADAMISILSDPAKAADMSRAARQRVEAHFSLEEYIRRHHLTYDKILRGRIENISISLEQNT